MSTLKRLWIIFPIYMLTGCLGNTAPHVGVKHYALEYALSHQESMSPVDTVIRIERFSAVQEFTGQDMVFRPKAFIRDAYRYHRWNVIPADMIQGLLLRDMRQAGYFRAVLSPGDSGDARYSVNGCVEEFLEVDEKDRSIASLAVAVTVMQSTRENSAGDVLMQKTYRIAEPFSPRSPDTFARSMSVATARFSAELIKDISAIIKGYKK